MKVCYDLKKRSWVIQNAGSNFTIGGNKLPIEAMKSGVFPKDLVCFDLQCNEQNLGPIIGIMTTRKKRTFTGNLSLFISLQKIALKHRGITIVFTPNSIYGDHIKGYLYLPSKDSWIKVTAPLPHVIYNRVPFRKSEKSSSFKHAFSFFKKKGIPFFNPCFIDKYELFLIGSKDTRLSKYLPDTILVSNPDDLEFFLKKHLKLYLKPAQSSKGTGIARIRLLTDGGIQLQNHQNNFSYPSFEAFWQDKGSKFLTKKYIAQEEITPALYNDQRFDFRILSHRNKEGYQITGVGIRVADDKNQLTTHVPKGGKIFPYAKVQNKNHDSFIQKIAVLCGETLTEHLGYFGEFSIDAGLTDTGKYIVYEINSKPMSFDEKEIEARRIKALYSTCLNLSGFTI